MGEGIFLAHTDAGACIMDKNRTPTTTTDRDRDTSGMSPASRRPQGDDDQHQRDAQASPAGDQQRQPDADEDPENLRATQPDRDFDDPDNEDIDDTDAD
jgi:hypothetical protein